jgi:hypothetical protein
MRQIRLVLAKAVSGEIRDNSRREQAQFPWAVLALIKAGQPAPVSFISLISAVIIFVMDTRPVLFQAPAIC